MFSLIRDFVIFITDDANVHVNLGHGVCGGTTDQNSGQEF